MQKKLSFLAVLFLFPFFPVGATPVKKEASRPTTSSFIQAFECGKTQGNSLIPFVSMEEELKKEKPGHLSGFNRNPWQIACRVLVTPQDKKAKEFSSEHDYLRVDLNFGQKDSLQTAATFYIDNNGFGDEAGVLPKVFSIPFRLFDSTVTQETDGYYLTSFVLSVAPVRHDGTVIEAKREKRIIKARIWFAE